MDNEDDIAACVREVLARRAAARSRPALTVAQLYSKYEAANRTRKSWPSVTPKLCPFVDAHADRPVESLTVGDWNAHAQRRKATPLPAAHGGKVAGRCYGVGTVNNELSCVKAMLNWSVAQGLLRFSPLAAARRTKTRRGRQTAPREWEIGQLLAACRLPGQTVMVLAAADVGMRRGEILQLRHDWIDHEAKTVGLPDWACKNGRGGVVPATQRFLDAVAAMPRHIRGAHVIVKPDGTGYSRQTLWEWWDELRARAGVEAAPGDDSAHLHDLRAACATNALARGVKLRTVSRRILRHSTLATTEIYLRGDDDDLAEATAAFERGILRDQEKRKGPKRSDVDFDAPPLPEHSTSKTTT